MAPSSDYSLPLRIGNTLRIDSRVEDILGRRFHRRVHIVKLRSQISNRRVRTLELLWSSILSRTRFSSWSLNWHSKGIHCGLIRGTQMSEMISFSCLSRVKDLIFSHLFLLFFLLSQRYIKDLRFLHRLILPHPLFLNHQLFVNILLHLLQFAGFLSCKRLTHDLQSSLLQLA